MIHPLFVPYDRARFPFRRLVEDALGEHDLEHLHEVEDSHHFTRATDQSTVWHRRFYDYVDTSAEWAGFYRAFVAHVADLCGEPVVYQRVPTFHTCFPGNVAVGEPHTDVQYGHSPAEMNVIVPVTAMRDSATIQVETHDGSGLFRPLDVPARRFLLFDAARLHRNEDNVTGQIRVSFDLRVIPRSVYVDNDRLTLNTRMPFRLPRYAEERTYFASYDRAA